MTENSISLDSQKKIYPQTDYRAHVSADSSHKKTCNPYGFPMMKFKLDLFIVDWQLSDDEKTPAIDGEKIYS